MTDQMYTVNNVCGFGCKEGDCTGCLHSGLIHDKEVTDDNVGSGLLVEGYLWLASQDPANMSQAEIDRLNQE